MGLFNKLKDPIFLKEDSNASRQLEQLKALRPQATGETAEKLEQEIKKVEAGIYGENQLAFELKNSQLPMYVLHDLNYQHNGLAAQIDYLIITRKRMFVIECKNLFGNIEINNSGDFIRTLQYGRRYVKEGIYSPITQNQRHLEIIRAMRAETKGVLAKLAFEKYFPDTFRSVIVLANPKTVLNDRFAPKEIKQQVIRVDQLIAHIKSVNEEPGAVSYSDKEMEDLAQYFLQQNQTDTTDYTEKFRRLIEQDKRAIQTKLQNNTTVKQPEKTRTEATDNCPRCGAKLILRTAKRGPNAGNQFYGCANYPTCKYIRNL